MSYNQSFSPQPGQGNLSAQFGGPQYQPSHGGSAPRDIPGRARRASSSSSAYGSYQPSQAGYGVTPPGGYSGSPSMAYSSPAGPYATSPSRQYMAPPSQIPAYGGPSMGQQAGPFGTSPSHLHPTASGGPPAGTGWQHPSYAPQGYGPSSYPPTEHRRSSTSSHKSSQHSSSDPSGKAKHKRRPSAPTRYDSPRRPTMTDSVLAAWGGIKGAFDSRK